MNNKILLIVLVALLAIYGLSRLFSGNKKTTFKAELIQVDTAAVSSITISPRGEEPPFTLKKEGGQWIATRDALSTKASQGAIQSLLGNLSLIKTKRIAAKSKDKWAEYQVVDSAGTRIQVYGGGGDLLEDFIIGKFDFQQAPQPQQPMQFQQQQQPIITSFIRLSGENETYAVEGMQVLSMGQGFDSYRNKNLLKMKKEMEVNAFEYQLGDSLLRFQKTMDGWATDGIVLDSMKVENYLNVLRNLSGTTFADDFDELSAGQYPQQQLTISGNNIEEPFRITVYRDTTREKPFVIFSNYNPETYFASDSSGIYSKLFKPVESFQAE
ncbi:MAG: DUF4340 domain-containing protein [Phaeodactylibacter sp.]|nr:DUF4340 domain-containing protein [Phaeodactylibacter sp.]MCB9265281.1 DUF4340 domain-containing protein [Lewinellaceae bacterium]MCB9287054.1 DUF4340 domain-containing protein [Lewinellaceae bacterium]